MPGKVTDNIIRKIKKELPGKPGVYLFYDHKGDIIYVGKSVDIRRRVLSYFQKSSNDRQIKVKAMVSGINNVGYYETVNDFLALLLEDKLIKQYYPYYNIRQKRYKRYKYLMLTNGLFPTVRVINSSRKIRNKRIFGPFKGKYDVDILLNIIRKYFKLRLCYESNPVTKCLYHDLDYCTAPCIMNIMPLEYTAIVNNVIDFLGGSIEKIIPLLKRELEIFVGKTEYESAQEIKEMISFCVHFNEKQKFFNRFKYGKLKLYDSVKNAPFCVFEKGRLRISTALLDNTISTSNNGLLLFDNELFNDSRILMDRAHIVHNWISGKRNNYRYEFAD